VAGYSVIDDVTGMGLKGKHVSSVFTEVLRYSLVIVVDSNEKIQSLIGTLKEAIKDYSGKMFLSDAEMV
jgi:PII-like signaling protein